MHIEHTSWWGVWKWLSKWMTLYTCVWFSQNEKFWGGQRSNQTGIINYYTNYRNFTCNDYREGIVITINYNIIFYALLYSCMCRKWFCVDVSVTLCACISR